MIDADDQIRTDRATLVDCIHHDTAACDAAADRLSKSPRENDRRMAAEWQAIRALEASRENTQAETLSAS